MPKYDFRMGTLLRFKRYKGEFGTFSVIYHVYIGLPLPDTDIDQSTFGHVTKAWCTNF